MRIRFEQTACSHIRISDANGVLLFMTSREELQQPIISIDHPVLIGMKQVLLNMNTALGINFTILGTVAESREF